MSTTEEGAQSKASKQNDSLVFAGPLPSSFKVIEAVPSASSLAVVNDKNEHTLRSELIPHESIELDDHDELGQYLKRQDTKIDLLLDLVTELLARQDQFPQEHELQLTAQGVSWCDNEQQLTVGTVLEANVDITASVPRPLRFFGEITTDSSNGEHQMQFTGVNQQVTDLLEKLLFRHHRRAVALQRSQS